MKTITWKLIGICLTAFIVALGLKIDKAEAATSITILTPNESVVHVNKSIPLTDTSIYVNDTVTTTLPTSLNSSGTDSNGNECVSHATDYVWTITSVKYSKDGKTFATDSFLPSINGDSTGATGIMSCKFPNDINHPAGFWQINVHVHVDYTSNCGNGSAPADYGPLSYSVGMGDFSVNVSPNTLTIPEGGYGTTNLTFAPLQWFSGTITSSLTGYTAGITGDSDSDIISNDDPLYNNPPSVPYNIYVAETVTSGTYPAIVTGTSGILNHAAPVIITVPKRYAEITSLPSETNNYSIYGKNNRDGSGSLSIDLPASLNTDGWHGAANMKTQNEQGFLSQKSYKWNAIYGGTNADTNGPYGGPGPAGSSFTLNDLLTTVSVPDANHTTLGESSYVLAAITNYGGKVPYNVSYTIHWHYPNENWVAQGNGGTLDSPSYKMFPGSGYVDSGLPVTVIVNYPTSTISDSAGVIGTAVLGVASTVVGSAGFSEAVCLSNPVSAVGATLLIAASFGVQAIAPSPPSPVSILTNDTTFLADIQIQQALNANPSSNMYQGSDGHSHTILDPDAPRVDSVSMQQITTTGQSTNPWYYSRVWSGSEGKIRVNVIPGRYRWVRQFIGNHYDGTSSRSGYTGSISTNLKYPGAKDCVRQWQIANAQPPVVPIF